MAQKATWQVTSQETDQVNLTAAGQTIVGSYVYFTTGEGNQGSVFVPDTLKSAKKVHAAIQQAANLLDEIGALHNGSFTGQ